MAVIRASHVAGAACALFAVLALAPHARAALPQLQSDVPINLDARSSDFDYKNNTLVFQGVRIAQGPLSLEADQAVATGLDFNDSKWVFKGNVKITTADGRLNSNDATVQFAKNEIRTALVTGGPASFEQKRDDGLARGRANRIEYDFGAGTVRLTEGAWLSDGTNEINGRTLLYSMKDKRVLATAADQGSQRVRITIIPQKNAGPKDPQVPQKNAGPKDSQVPQKNAGPKDPQVPQKNPAPRPDAAAKPPSP
jgi:lipopolysaccharide export system protein LptA